MIKKTSPENYQILANLEKECFPEESWNLAQIKSHHEGNESLLYFEEGEKLPLFVGYLMYNQNPFELEILRVGVIPKFRRKGVAEQLIDTLISQSEGKDILLEVKSGNFPAIELYKKKGFLNFAVRKRYYPDENDAILMKRKAKND